MHKHFSTEFSGENAKKTPKRLVQTNRILLSRPY